MLEDAIEVLTKFKIEQSMHDHEKNITTMIEISKVDLIGICINLCRILKNYEVEYDNKH